MPGLLSSLSGAGVGVGRGFYIGRGRTWIALVKDWLERVAVQSGTVSGISAPVAEQFAADLIAAGLREDCYRCGIAAGTNRLAMQVPFLLGDGTNTYGSATDTITAGTPEGDRAYYGTECVESGIYGGVYLNTASYNGSGFTSPNTVFTANINMSTTQGSTRPHSLAIWYADNWRAAGTTNQTRGFIGGANNHVTQISGANLWFNQPGFGADGRSVANPVGLTGLVGWSRTTDSSATCYRNGATLGTITGATAAPANANLTVLASGHIPAVQFYWYGKPLTGTKWTALHAAVLRMQQGFSRSNYGVTQMVCLGDSITSGFTGTGGITPYPEYLRALKPTWQIRNFGKPGITLGDGSLAGARQIFNSNIIGMRPDDIMHLRCVLVILIGTNDLNNGVSAATLQTNVESLCSAATAVGFETVVVTPPNRKDGSTWGVAGSWDATKETVRTTFRDNMLASTVPDLVLNGDTVLPDANDATKFQADKLHPNAGGLSALADFIHANVP